MAPTKNARANAKQNAAATATTGNTSLPLACKGFTRKSSQNYSNENPDVMAPPTRAKRKAEHSPVKNDKIKRSALGNVTNNANKQTMTTHPDEDVKQGIIKKVDSIQANNQNGMSKQKAAATMQKHTNTRIITRASSRLQNNSLTKILEDPVISKSQEASATGIVTRSSSRLQQSIKANIIVKVEEAPEVKSCEFTINDVLATAATNGKQKSKSAENAPLAPTFQSQQQKLSVNKPGRRISNEFSEESVYMSAIEDMSSDASRLSGNFEALRRRSSMLHKINEHDMESVDAMNVSAESEKKLKEELKQQPPPGVEDFDQANWDDQFQVSHYARDIFNYLKEREASYPIANYMPQQIHLSKWMRALLVDWMVEVQETFELNHETLYLAVKVVDLYLCKAIIHKEKLQLLGAAALFIACKYDERTPPLIEDFLYICDGAYNHKELVHMEMHTLRTIGYDLGMPLSYRFLRRYARCGKIPMVTLTLARYILELSLMDYETISLSDSKRAAAALFMALRLHGDACGWNVTLAYHSGYQMADFIDMVPILNAGMHRKPKSTIKTIKSKYSHKIFHEVAKIAPMTNNELFNIKTDESLSDESQYSPCTSATGTLIDEHITVKAEKNS